MPESYGQKVDRLLGDFEGIRDDGEVGNGELPDNDRSKEDKIISKQDLRDLLKAPEAYAIVAEAAAARVEAYGPRFNSVADLLASTETYAEWNSGDYIQVIDGGHLYKVVSSASPASDYDLTNSGGVRLQVLPDDRGYNIKAFGAMGVFDFATMTGQNVSPIMNKAFARAGNYSVIYFPKGDYAQVTSVQFNNSHIVVEGDPGARLVTNSGTSGMLCLRPIGTSDANRPTNVTIRGLTFYDPTPETHVESDQTHGIGAVRVDHLLIEDCIFDNLGDESVEINRCYWATAQRNIFTRAASLSSAGGGITVSSSRAVLLFDNKFIDGPLGQAIRVEIAESGRDNQDIRIIANHFRGQQTSAAISISLGSANLNGAIIAENQFENCRWEAITLVQSAGRYIRDVTISNNVVIGGGDLLPAVSGSYRGAIYGSGDRNERVAVSGNVITNWGNAAGHMGIAFFNATITGNIVTGCADSGIMAEGNSIVTGNRCVGNGLSLPSGGRAGIQHGPSALITGNLCQGNYTGIHSRTGATGAVISDNMLIGNTRGLALSGPNLSTRNTIKGNITGIAMSGTGPETRDDIYLDNATHVTDSSTGGVKRSKRPSQFITENSGAVSVPAAPSKVSGQDLWFVDVSTGLSQAAVQEEIQLFPLSDIGAVTKFWPEVIGTSTFRLIMNAQPGGSGCSFGWKIQKI